MDIHLLLIIALVLFSTKALALLTSRLHMPQVVGALVAGVLLGPAVFNLVEPNETISAIAEFGVLLLLFSAGLETDLKQLSSSMGSSLLIATSGITLAIAGGFLVALLITGPSLESFFIGVVIASTSTSITVEAMHEMDKLRTKSGTALMGVSVIDDVIGIIILAIVLGMSESGFSFEAVWMTLLKIITFFMFATLCGIIVNKLFSFMYDNLGVKRRLSIFALAFCFLMSYLAEQFGLASITGAYIAGVAFCNTRCAEYLETRITVLSYMIFTPVFLANIGIHASFGGLNGSIILFTALLVIVSMLTKVIGCGLGAKICKFTNKESLQIGIGMMTRGEITLIVASKGISHNLMDSQLFSSIIVVVLITVLITPIFLKAVYEE